MNKQKLLRVMVLVAGVTCLGLPGVGAAQEWYGTYEISFPTGDTNNYISETSFRGFGLSFRKRVAPATTAGLLFGWNVFYERTSDTIQLQNQPGAVTGTQDRTVNSFPIMAGGHRYFTRRRAQPFVGLNVGGYIMLQRFAIGLVAIDNDRWDWGIAPRVDCRCTSSRVACS